MTEPAEHGPGAELAGGRYRLEHVIGRGGMAVVWLARDQRLQRPVAIKVIADTLAADADYLERFAREARLAAGLSHANLVDVYDYSAQARPPFLVMEYVDGGTLADRIDAGRRLDAPEVRAVARDLLSALDTVHRAGILHRDLKPANVLVGTDGRARLSDFGIARDDDATRLTRTGQVIGTLRYMAPEVTAGRPAVPQSDLYALGRLIEALAGDEPPDDLRPLVSRLTDADPDARPRSARDALHELGDPDRRGAVRPTTYRRRDPTRTQPRQTRPLTGKRTRRVPALLAAAGGLLIALALVLALSGGGGDDPPSQLDRQLDRIERLIQSSER